MFAGSITSDKLVSYTAFKIGSEKKVNCPIEINIDKTLLFSLFLIKIKYPNKRIKIYKTNDKITNTLKSDLNALNSKKAQVIGITSTILGGGLGYYLARNKKPLTAALVAGLTGVTTGFASLLLFFTSTIKNVKKSVQSMKDFDLKEYKD